MTKTAFDRVEDALTVLKNGGVIILADGEDRENEGDLVALGENITPETVHFMLTEARGLLCAPIAPSIAEKLAIGLMVENSTDPHGTPFTVTVDGTEAATGVTTGVSAFDRAATIAQLAKADATPSDFNRPGHTQPLIPLANGLRARIGHTEASVDLALLAGSAPVSAIIEILKEDGTMARRDSLFELSERLDLPFITIDQIVEYMDDNDIAYAGA
ncbi:MAG TPA: 3,4-dihydroxy-2-butanone-4-phosphate synthase [Lactobacillaceae bacterium]|jgi:3,4-dihydroxy 2-butanone 4-phosphate synthase/GTP cyclohydrolase II